MADKRPELLAPAGGMERLVMALTYGADAVYLSAPQFGMRAAADNFTPDEMAQAVSMCRARGVRVYVAANAVMRPDDMASLPPYFEQIQALGVDAVIVSDLGALALARKHAPNLKIHVSTQTGIANAASARLLHELGASRVILARELTLEEIKKIRRDTPTSLELEAFVHGSMCMAFSGRCLLSDFMTGRGANQGACAQPCRWTYKLIEDKRPDEPIELTEDGGTFFLSSRDMCMIEHLPALLDAGLDSLKIEGRQKSFYYTAVVTSAYRRVLDAVLAGAQPDPVWLAEVDKVSHRAYSTGFFFNAGGPGQTSASEMYESDCDVAAVVESCAEDGTAELTQRNKIKTGDRLELLTPDDRPVMFTAGAMTGEDGTPIDATPHPMMRFSMKLPISAPRYSIVRSFRDHGRL